MLSNEIKSKEKLNYRPGYDVTVIYTDSTSDMDYPVIFYFESQTEPSDNDLTERITHIGNNIQAEIDKESE